VCTSEKFEVKKFFVKKEQNCFKTENALFFLEMEKIEFFWKSTANSAKKRA